MYYKSIVSAALLAASSFSAAANLEVTLTNTTKGIYFTPVLLGAHSDTVTLFALGETASSAIESIAEGGDIQEAVTALSNAAANIATGQDDALPGASDGPLAPGASFTTALVTDDENEYLSLATMLLPTNDGFVGLDRWKIPSEPGTYTVYLNAYDAGTEMNDELAANIPNAPFVSSFGTPGETVITSGGTGVTETGDENGVVHIHRGNLGDLDADAGDSDIDASVHRWLNPVATMTVTVQ